MTERPRLIGFITASRAAGHRYLPGELATALLCCLGLALGCGTTLAPPPSEGSHATYRVDAPDRLQVTILPDPPMSKTVTVRPDGMISLDLIGDVPAGGRTVEEISADVQKRISRYKRDANVTISLESAESTAVTVIGEVRKPQSFPLRKKTRVAEAIGQVGGVTSWGFASSRNVRVIRSEGGETAVYKVDLGAIKKGDLRTNIMLTRGDIVYVPSTAWAKVGYVIQAILFPFQPFIGVATSAAGNLVTP